MDGLAGGQVVDVLVGDVLAVFLVLGVIAPDGDAVAGVGEGLQERLLFGVIAAAGIRILVEKKVDYTKPRNLVLTSVVLVSGVSGAAVKLGARRKVGSLRVEAAFWRLWAEATSRAPVPAGPE